MRHVSRDVTSPPAPGGKRNDVSVTCNGTRRPWTVKTRKELLQNVRPHQWQYLREDNGDVPEGGPKPTPQRVIMAQAV